MSRRIQSPGIEVNEFDRSQYNTQSDNSIVDTTSLIMGFSDIGPEYQTTYINSLQTFKNIYGSPKNEAEKYFYNAAYEIINRQGRLYCSRLPYDNIQHNMYSFTTYTVDTLSAIPLSTTSQVLKENKESYEEGSNEVNMYDILFKPRTQLKYAQNIYADYLDELLIADDINKYLIADIEGDKVNYCKFFDDNGINLSIITDLFEYLYETINFSDTNKELILNTFYKNDKTNCKSEAVYMLQDLDTDLNLFLSTYIKQEERANLSSEFNEIRTQIKVIGNIEKQIENFSNKKQLDYYVEYMSSLKNIIETKTYEKEDDKIIKTTLVIMYNKFLSNEILKTKYTQIRMKDDSIESYMNIYSNGRTKDKCGLLSIEKLDNLRTGHKPNKNDIVFIDISRSKYNVDNSCKKNKEYVGIVPLIVTPMAAMKIQNIIDVTEKQEKDFITIQDLQNIYSLSSVNQESIISGLNNEKDILSGFAGFTQNFGSESIIDKTETTLSKTVDKFFPAFTFNKGRLDKKQLKKICVVVLTMFVDKANENQISFQPVESFVGSLNCYEKDDTGKSLFIDNVINNNSKYINCFSNVEFSREHEYEQLPTDNATMFNIVNQTITSLGFYSAYCRKTIGLEESIQKAMSRILDKLNDPNRYPIDLVIDAGVSNIAQFIASVYPLTKNGYYEPSGKLSYMFNLNSEDSVKIWKTIINKYDEFCKYTRKDCMFIADCLRPLCLDGEEKIVRNTNIKNTVKNTILKNIGKVSGYINSSYGAGYCDWFRVLDQSSWDYFWCPPSIKAAGVYVYTDAYTNYWNAPAGINRAKMQDDVIDVAFSPTQEEAGEIYNNNWNYCIQYPIDGIVIEGQKTFQKNKTAFDRVNVRRLFLGLEKEVRYVAKFFTYEGINDYLIERFTDQIDYIMQETRDRGGISEYYIVCDERNNNIQTIENNELHCTIAVKPIKALEFIVLNFICTAQNANVQEVAESEL